MTGVELRWYQNDGTGNLELQWRNIPDWPWPPGKWQTVPVVRPAPSTQGSEKQ
jgi:hypothetical protein